jgi:hypothetical protein
MPSSSNARLPGRLCAGVLAAAAGAGVLAAPAHALAAHDHTLAGRDTARRPAPPPAAPRELLYLGSRGRTVAELQRKLHLRAGGRFDRRTARAVRAFQRRHHLLVDGVVGVYTWDAVFGIKPPPLSAATSTSTPTAAYGSGGGYSIPAGIVACESGGNYGAVNPSSGAGGAYQILPSTWAAYGGQGLPENAPPAEQDRIAAEIYATQGPSAWTC